MSNQAIAIKIETNSDERYFESFGKGGRVQTAWSLAGAKLFLACTRQDLDLVTSKLEAKNKNWRLVDVGEISANQNTPQICGPIDLSHVEEERWREALLNHKPQFILNAGGVHLAFEEHKHYTAISKMKPVNLEFIRQYALEQFETSKFAATVTVWNGNPDDEAFMKEDAFEWAQLARGLSREIRKQGGL